MPAKRNRSALGIQLLPSTVRARAETAQAALVPPATAPPCSSTADQSRPRTTAPKVPTHELQRKSQEWCKSSPLQATEELLEATARSPPRLGVLL